MKLIEKNLDAIISTTNRIEKIITGLLYFSKDNNNEAYSTVSLASIIDETLIFCQEKMNSKDINLIHPLIDSDIFIECSSVQISQVILNLLNNSIDAVEKCLTKWIKLEVKLNNNEVSIFISDSGPGVPHSIRSKLMQPFITTKETDKGTGLGLSISKGIIEKHNGSLALIESAPHTTFRIDLKRKTEI